jgi:hypothetical protein
MDKVREQIIGSYLARLGQDKKEQVETWMDSETWFTAQEAKDAGFIDTITGAVEIAARVQNFNLSAFGRVPEAVAVAGKQPAAQNKPQPNTIMKNLLKLLATAGVIANSDVSEDSACAEAKTYLDKLTTENKDLNAKLTNLNTRVQELLTDQAEAAIQAAVDSKRIKDDKDLRAKWVAAYLNDPESTKALLDAIEVQTPAPATRQPAGHPPINTGAAGNSADEQMVALENELKNETDGSKRYAIVNKIKKLREGATA